MGFVRKRNGRWQGGYKTPANSQRTRTFDTKKEAERWVNGAETDKARGIWVDPTLGKMTLGRFYADYYLPTQANLALSTRANEASVYRSRIKPRFAHIQLTAIDHMMIQRWVNEMTAEKLMPSYISATRKQLGKILQAALLARMIGYDPMPRNSVKTPQVEYDEAVFMTADQVHDLAAAMRATAPRYEALVWIGCYCGLRIGELAGLSWADIDTTRKLLTVGRSVGYVAGHGLVEKAPKSRAGRRVVPIPQLVVDRIEAHRAQFGGAALPDDRVFTSPKKAGPFRPTDFRNRFWAKAITTAKLDPKPTPHDMRHTAVSIWIAKGASDIQIARWAGHTSVSFTKDRYGHLFPDNADDVMGRLDDTIVEAGDEQKRRRDAIVVELPSKSG